MKKQATLVVLAFLIALPAFSRGILVTPSQLSLTGKPGEAVSGKVRISSSRSEKNLVRVTFTDFTRDEEGSTKDIDGNPRSCRSWIDVDQRQVTTPENGPVEIRVTARIPKDATGSYWTMLDLGVLPAAQTTEAPAAQIVPTVGVMVFVTVAGTEKPQIDVIESRAVQSATGDYIDAESVVQNNGNTAVLINGAYALERQAADGGEEIASGNFSPVMSLPGAKTKVKIRMPWKGSTAGLQMHAYLRYGAGIGDSAEAVTSIEDESKEPRAPSPMEKLFPKKPAEGTGESKSNG